jgi:hypothetical protein
VIFPGWKDSIKAEIVVRDKVNDLAILRLADAAKLADACRELPFQVTSAKGTALGQHISTIGYPLSALLG